MSVTIKDIAKKAGVSHITVSRALNSSGYVKAEKKEEIMKLAKEMGYTPSRLALNFKSSRSYTIGLYFSTVSEMTSPFILYEIVSTLYKYIDSKYFIVVKGIDTHKPGTLSSTQFDGLLVLSQTEKDDFFLEEVMQKNIPVVVIAREVEFPITNVLVDEKDAICKAMKYLLENGHRKIGVLEGDPSFASNKNRHEGWIKAAKAFGVDSASIPYEYGYYSYNQSMEAVKKLLNYDLSAILCFNDEMAFGAEQIITSRGLRIPDDISLIGFDNWDISMYAKIQLTTIERDMGKLAKVGLELLMDQVERKTRGEKIVPEVRKLDTCLVVRESVKSIL